MFIYSFIYYLLISKNLPPTFVTDYFFGGRSKELLIPSPPLNLILFQFPIPETFIQIMASISRPLKNVVPTLPIVAKRIGGGGTSAFSEGVPAAVGPRALSPRESRGEVHRQRRTQAGQRLPNDVLTKENRYAWFTHAREDASKGVQGAGVRRGGYIYIYTYWWKAVGEAIEGKGERRATLLPSCSLLPRTKGTERELYARSTHVILYKRTRRGILTMLPPRSLDQSCPESHARCEPSWLSSSSQFFPCLPVPSSIYFHFLPLCIFALQFLFLLMTFPGSMRTVVTQSGGERREEGRGGVVRVFIECVGVDSLRC